MFSRLSGCLSASVRAARFGGPALAWCHAGGAVLALAVLLIAGSVYADEKGDHAGLGNEAGDARQMEIPGVGVTPPIARERGSIIVSIEGARQFGNPKDPNSLYCEVDVSVYNFSPKNIRDLAVSVAYDGPDGPAGSSLSIFHELSTGVGADDLMNQLSAGSCRGLSGKTTVLTCLTDHSEDCSAKVQGVAAGAIPLK